MQKQLNELAPLLEQKKAAAQKLLAQVTKEQAEAASVAAVVAAEEAEVAARAAQTQKLKDEAAADLLAALPALEAAIKVGVCAWFWGVRAGGVVGVAVSNILCAARRSAQATHTTRTPPNQCEPIQINSNYFNPNSKALDALNKADIIEMKTFTKPPGLVALTMEGVCILLQVRLSRVGWVDEWMGEWMGE